MTRTILFLLTALLAAPLFAHDIGAAQPDARGGWLLLENPPGSSGEGLSEFAGDPGLPAPDPLGWPHNSGTASGGYPQTELWHYDAAKAAYSRATHYLSPGSTAFQRTLVAVFTIDGKPYVLHYDPYLTLKKGQNQVLRVDEAAAKANGEVPAASVVFTSAEFIDAPSVSPDNKRIAFRAFTLVDGKFQISLRVYSTEDWKLIAESAPRTFARPVWIDDESLAVIAWDASGLPQAPQRDTAKKYSLGILEANTPQPGKLLRLDLAEGKLTVGELLSAEFPPDRYTDSLQRDPFGLGLVVARKDGEDILAEMREPKADGETREIARFEAWRGCSVSMKRVRCAGVRTIERARTFVISDVYRWGEIVVPGPEEDFRRVIPVGDKLDVEDIPLPQISPESHGGMIDLGRGVFGLLEPVMNPEFDAAAKNPDKAQLLRHTLAVLSWPGCDSMRNPRVIQQLSKLVRRFAEIGEIRSTLLAFDIDIAANNGQNQKSGRMIELYSAKGAGSIRTEDNLGGKWIVQSADSGDYYSCVGENGAMDKAKVAGKAYDDLITQLEARKLLILTGVEKDPDNGGLTFLYRDYYHDPNSGATWRTWVFMKYGRKLPGGGSERAIVRFVADLPIGSAGDWKFPHAIAQVQLRFALANGRGAADTELTFEPDRWVALPHLVDLKNNEAADKRGKDLLLPKVFRIYQRDANGKLVQQLKATAVVDKFKHPVAFVKSGEIVSGYEVPLVAFGNKQFTDKQR